MLYENSYMETYRTTHATLDQPCQVRIETGIITISTCKITNLRHTADKNRGQVTSC